MDVPQATRTCYDADSAGFRVHKTNDKAIHGRRYKRRASQLRLVGKKMNSGPNPVGDQRVEQATIIYPGTIKGRATIELRVFPDGRNEAYLVPTATAPIPTGVSLYEKNGKYFLSCRIRKKKLAFKPEEVVRQKVLNYLIDELSYPAEQIAVEVGIQMGSAIHEKPADIVVYTDDKKTTAWLIVAIGLHKRG